ncbi:hypothetical protein OHC33_004973 [Knufia fluminis]|uniref:Uncharacterized protein n=1 Tax=Knufia fluminis TaxID=191047 RepID=A0AAN8I5X7_9EURO|nr:hypothetical protein OHC33_004973 [Knufia fluminis]
MCRKNVILFDCGHTRKLDITLCNDVGIECANPERVLIPEGGGIGIEAPKDKVKWSCAFKCVPGVVAYDPLVELAKENADVVKAEIDHKIEVLSVLSTPFATPSRELGGFNFDQRFLKSVTPGREQTGFNFDQRFANSVTRRLHSAASSRATTPEARDDMTFNFTNMKLKIPSEKLKATTIKEEKNEGNEVKA